jgi:hypothetical protein
VLVTTEAGSMKRKKIPIKPNDGFASADITTHYYSQNICILAAGNHIFVDLQLY